MLQVEIMISDFRFLSSVFSSSFLVYFIVVIEHAGNKKGRAASQVKYERTIPTPPSDIWYEQNFFLKTNPYSRVSLIMQENYNFQLSIYNDKMPNLSKHFSRLTTVIHLPKLL